MSVVKRMTAKEDFLDMPLKDRNCEVEQYEDCRTRKLMGACNCVPWEAPGFEVELHVLNSVQKLTFFRVSTSVTHKEETASKRTLQGLSIAAQLVRGSMQMFGGFPKT